jgi:hypothetical protein
MTSPLQIREKLPSAEFELPNLAGSRAVFRFPATFQGWPRGGMEACVVPVTAHMAGRGAIPSILKAFNHELPIRAQRLDRLVSYGLVSKHDWLFSGVPYASVRLEVNGLRLEGHVCRHVCDGLNGDDLSRLKDNDGLEGFERDQRAWLAEQLCCAVAALETKHIVHGDLSPGNIVIGFDDSRKHMQCVPIDYDGFRSPEAPRLPRRHGNAPVRPLGTPGYQHPTLMRRIDADKSGTDDTIEVENDRFALAVLCCELMIWQSSLRKELGRSELLDVDELAAGQAAPPRALVQAWPEGAELLGEALRVVSPGHLPDPDQWLRALGRIVGGQRPEPWGGGRPPRIWISRYRGSNSLELVQELLCGEGRKGSGDLAAIHPELKAVRYEYNTELQPARVSLTFDWPEYVALTRQAVMQGVDGRGSPRPLQIEVGPRDVVRSKVWRFDFGDDPPDHVKRR